MPPAFVLSQDQTLQTKKLNPHLCRSFLVLQIWSLRIFQSDLFSSIQLRFLNLAISKSDSGSSHYSIFKELSGHKKTGSAKVAFINTPLVTAQRRPLTPWSINSNVDLTFNFTSVSNSRRGGDVKTQFSTLLTFVKRFFEFFQLFWEPSGRTPNRCRTEWRINLAAFWDLSNAFLNFFQTFLWTSAARKLATPDNMGL